MSEKLYAVLLRFFPSHFRESYGEDALQLFRDRARHETGFPSRARLWLDLLADLAISVPREYFYAQPELLSASATRNPPGSPSFYVLNQASPRPGALLFGFLLSFAALLTFSNLLNQGGQHRTLRASSSSRQTFSSRSSKSAPRPSLQAADDTAFSLTGETSQQTDRASSAPRSGATCCAPSRLDPSVSSASQSATSDSNSQFARNGSASAAVVTPSSPLSSDSNDAPNPHRDSPTSVAPHSQISASERHSVITAASDNLKRYYHSPDLAQKMSDSLFTHERRGDDAAAADGAALAALLTRQMRDVSHDLHLDMLYSAEPLPQPTPMQTSQPSASYRDFLEHNNCTFEKVQILPSNIGYLKVDSFPDLSVCQPTAIAAMAHLNHAKALIFDLRDNRGGQPETVAFLASYLFDHPEYFYNPRENTTQNSWTHSPVPGNLLADKPVYILTSSRTSSGAEQFCYDLKMLKRATLVGETTAGAAHAGVFHRLDDHFGIGIPEAKPINPYATADWAETGVTPDINVPAADALATAQKLALARLKQK